MEKLTLQEALAKLRELVGTHSKLDTLVYMNLVDLIAAAYLGGYEEGVASTLKNHAPDVYDIIGQWKQGK
jgi:hypothetical protein